MFQGPLPKMVQQNWYYNNVGYTHIPVRKKNVYIYFVNNSNSFLRICCDLRRFLRKDCITIIIMYNTMFVIETKVFN